jgi:hypothetical protein
MTDDTPGDHIDRHAPMARGALGAWWWQGTRSAFFMRPDWRGLQTTPVNIACLVLVPFALGLLMQRLYIDGPASFYWPALGMGWFSTAISAWVCWLLVPRAREQVDNAQRPLDAASLFSMMAAQGLTIGAGLSIVFVPMVRSGSFSQEVLGTAGWWTLWLLSLGWMAAAPLALVWRSGTPRLAPRAVASALLLATLAVHQWLLPARYWYPSPTETAESATDRFTLTQEMMEKQADALAHDLRALKPQRPGRIDVYAITFAPYADQAVFRRESAMVARVMQERFDAAGRTIELVNEREAQAAHAWATPLNLKRAIARAAQLMDRDEDVLFIHLTSHGARNGSLATSFWPLSVESVTPPMLRRWLDEAGIRYRVISVSACYSGSWIEPLAEPATLVMTAADADHTSYGCGSRSDLTFFGRAMFDEQMRHTWDFERAHASARKLIEQREREAGKTDGFSNPQIRVGPAIREHLARLAAERAATATPQ